MMTALFLLFAMFMALALYSLHADSRKEKAHAAEREEWRRERQHLLDRIQAPTFDHLKHHEVKIIKAQSGEKEPPQLEQL